MHKQISYLDSLALIAAPSQRDRLDPDRKLQFAFYSNGRLTATPMGRFEYWIQSVFTRLLSGRIGMR